MFGKIAIIALCFLTFLGFVIVCRVNYELTKQAMELKAIQPHDVCVEGRYYRIESKEISKEEYMKTHPEELKAEGNDKQRIKETEERKKKE